ncbi:hypothetical protein N0B31_20680 [Salinirubellus salinus]|uniref:Uncharacterized protein n=1 Tax=Salinirubellus salinus TaxID=1364945 RepID=A0A9E7R2I2_9EURY|nr:hypothetical protein [Salinirubellus salinus]UWM54524.1 hypothetical protein N0B31_20680 [Salinirubellus salinus]
MRDGDGERGQAFTIEGITAAVVLLTAVLLAVQAVVVTPTTRGTVDEDVRTELRQQTEDVLWLSSAGADPGEDLSTLVRYWEPNGQTFAGATNPTVGYGRDAPPTRFGTLLNQTFTQRGYLYNVELRYRTRTAGESKPLTLVSRGVPDENAVVASWTVTLYDDDTLTGPGAGGAELSEYDTDPADGDDGYYPVPDAVDGPVYNVVEVRVVVW